MHRTVQLFCWLVVALYAGRAHAGAPELVDYIVRVVPIKNDNTVGTALGCGVGTLVPSSNGRVWLITAGHNVPGSTDQIRLISHNTAAKPQFKWSTLASIRADDLLIVDLGPEAAALLPANHEDPPEIALVPENYLGGHFQASIRSAQNPTECAEPLVPHRSEARALLAQPIHGYIALGSPIAGGASGSPVVVEHPERVAGIYVGSKDGKASVLWLSSDTFEEAITALQKDPDVRVKLVGPDEERSVSLGLRPQLAVNGTSLSGEHAPSLTADVGAAFWFDVLAHRFQRAPRPFDHVALGAEVAYRYGFEQERYRLVAVESPKVLELRRDRYHSFTLGVRIGLAAHYVSRWSVFLVPAWLVECPAGLCAAPPNGPAKPIRDRFGFSTTLRARYALHHALGLTLAVRAERLPSRLSVIRELPYAQLETRAFALGLELGLELDWLGHLTIL